MRVNPAELTRMSARPNSSRTAAAAFLISALSSSGKRIGFLAGAGGAFDDRLGAVSPLVVADDDPRPGLGKEPRAGGADPAAGAGDDRDLAGEVLTEPRRHPCSPRTK